MFDFNVCIAGAAGDGVKEAGEVLAKLFSRMGYNVFVYQEYESLIRGGHNASVVRISDRKVHAHRFYYDAMICLEDYVLKNHIERLKGFLIHDAKFECEYSNSFPVPLSEFVKEENLSFLYRNAAALGSFCHLSGVELKFLNEVFQSEYGEKSGVDVELAKIAFDYAERNFDRLMEIPAKKSQDGNVFSGSEAIALGMVDAGLEYYFAYPMTPASPVLHFLAKKKLAYAIQPESEIAAIMMAIGSAYAGKRSATGTSGGGFALMSESISLAAMAEIPLLIILAQRSAPSTGMATFTAQEDLYFSLSPAHGEFPVIVASPLTLKDSYILAGTLLNLAWKFQTPTILLTEKHMTESYENEDLDGVEVEEVDIFSSVTDDVFPRYEITESGISRFAVPPAIVKCNSNEHDEFGITTDDAKMATEMYAKRMRKEEEILKEVKKLEPYWLIKNGQDTIVTWGSNFGAVLEAAEELGYSVLGIRFLRPLILPKLGGNVICVECNYRGLLAGLIERETGIDVARVLRWDGRPFTPEEVKEELARR
ncbi:2-oxoacid:acceptor oxidoreductase subunit alpha [Archaeoglobus neptunius]|uniref:2-oxoacid:acceptor oxidoreductase subunit alpha n=1 Tax=Archaeoglobus neptunius TaxID=2798580 RepID=UPI001925AA42|nr:2-oxoacid:acceptor oxidoreductase subunit alpha [Archaeoglobus neptunius]